MIAKSPNGLRDSWTAGSVFSCHSACLFLTVAMVAIIAEGCGPSTAEKKAEKAEEARKVEQLRLGQERKARLSQLRTRYYAVDFPGERLNADSFTLDIQNFVLDAGGSPIMCRATLVDVEKTKEGMFAEFRCKLGGDFSDAPHVAMRLRADPEQLGAALSTPRKSSKARSGWMADLHGKHYIVIANIDSIQKSRCFDPPVQLDGFVNGEFVSFECHTANPTIMIDGRLVALVDSDAW